MKNQIEHTPRDGRWVRRGRVAGTVIGTTAGAATVAFASTIASALAGLGGALLSKLRVAVTAKGVRVYAATRGAATRARAALKGHGISVPVLVFGDPAAAGAWT